MLNPLISLVQVSNIKPEKIISSKDNLLVLHEDNHIIVVNKRVGDIVQGDKTGDKPLSDVVKEFLKEKFKLKKRVLRTIKK